MQLYLFLVLNLQLKTFFSLSFNLLSTKTNGKKVNDIKLFVHIVLSIKKAISGCLCDISCHSLVVFIMFDVSLELAYRISD